MDRLLRERVKKITGSVVTLSLIFTATVLLSWFSARYSTVIDITRNSRHTLSAASTSLLVQIEGAVSITAYARENNELRNAIRQVIGQYQAIKPDINLAFINPDTAPDEVRELGIRINGELLFEYNGRTEHVRSADESTIINTLARLWKGEQHWVAYLTGHGERDLLGAANHDLGNFGLHLNKRGFLVQPLNLAEISTVPDNTSILVITGARLPFHETEKETLLEFIDGGGNFIWLQDPNDLDDFSSELQDYLDLQIGPGIVIDTAGRLIGIDDPTMTIITGSLYTQHPVLNNFSYTTVYPHATAILPGDSQTWTTSPLLMTGNQAWLETSPLQTEAAYDPDQDLQGPLTIGLTLSRQLADNPPATNEDRGQRAVVIGDGDFLSNTYLENSGNLELGMRIFSWLAHQEDLIEIPVRITNDKQLSVSTTVMGTIGILFLVVLPLLFLSVSIYLWWKRRSSW